jgi:hypothetical protein
VKVARVEGIDTTARALRLDRSRLEARMKTEPATAMTVVHDVLARARSCRAKITSALQVWSSP